LTGIGWVQDFSELDAKGRFVPALIFYYSYIYLSTFIIAKAVTAVLVANLEAQYKALELKAKKRHQRLKVEQNFKAADVAVHLPLPKADSLWANQIPFEVPDFDHISVDKLQNYLAILSIIETNLGEYKMLKDRLSEIQVVLKSCNRNLNDEK
jgi:hypothetical protein